MSDDELHKAKVEIFRLLNGLSVKDCITVLKASTKEYKQFGLSNVLDVPNEMYDDWSANKDLNFN